MEFEICYVVAKGDFGKPLDLSKLAREIPGSMFNEGFKGGRLDVEIIDAVSLEKVGCIQLYHTGKCIINSRSELDTQLSIELLINKIKDII